MISRVLAIVVGLALATVSPQRSVAAPAKDASTSDKTSSKARASRSGRKGTKLAFDATAPSRTLYLVGGDAHIGDGTIVKSSVIRIVGARLASIGGADARGTIPSDADVVDVSGKIITPGLIAADANIGLVEIGAEDSTRNDGRDDDKLIRAGYDASTAIDSSSSLIQVNAIEGVTSAAVSPGGGLISGQVAWIDLLHGSSNPVAKPRIAVDATMGQVVGSSRAATLAKLREALADARFYRSRRGAFDRRQSRDLVAHPLDLEALFPVLDRRVPLVVAADSTTDMLALLDLAREQRIRVVIVGGAQAWKIAGQLAKADVTVIVQPSSNLPQSFGSLGARLDNAALLHAAGVDVGVGGLGAHNLRNITQEAGLAVANGLDHAAAIRAMTLNIATAYGMDRDYGSLEAGKVANVVVWDGDPLELSSTPTHVYVRGQSIPLVSRQTLLRDRYLDLSRFRR